MDHLESLLRIFEPENTPGNAGSNMDPSAEHGGAQNSIRSAVQVSFDDAAGSSDINEVVLSVFWKRGKLGAACYVCDNSEVKLLNDVVDVHPDFNHLRCLVNQLNPTRVVTCGGLYSGFIKALVSLIERNSVEDSDLPADASRAASMLLPENLHVFSTKKQDLQYEACRRQVLGTRFGFEPTGLSDEEHIVYLQSKLDMKAEGMVISLGMLMRYLDKFLPQLLLTHDRTPILFLSHVSLDRMVSLDEVTYSALQIFNVRLHPSAFKRYAGGNREGLSVFGVLNRCRTVLGSKRMRQILASPSKDLDTINNRLNAVQFCVKHQHIVANLVSCIKHVKNVNGILSNLYQTRGDVSHWKALYSTLYNTILTGQVCQSMAEHSPLFDKLAKSITPDIHEVAHNINRVVDFEQSTSRNQFSVRIGIDSKLDLLRQTYSQVPDVLVKVAALELQDLPQHIEQCSIVFITELGYLLSIPVWLDDDADITAYQLPNFDVKFILNKFVHYKTPRCCELNNVLGDLVALMSGIESQIMVDLIQFVKPRASDIVTAVQLVAELDCVIALSAVATENNYHRPQVVEERCLQITNGRHPLQELCVDNFVPNDTSFSTDGGLVKILTGPNASGKSVYLKQVALIAYLAHVGSFVPAEQAVIGVLDHIHSRIQTVETVATTMSSFLIDLKQMSHALYNSTPSSLIIIDEFGKGTTEIDGLSLLAASLVSLTERGHNCPMVLVSTHFHKLPDLITPCPLIHLQFMSFVLESDEVVYLHKIKDGTAGTSLSFFAARAAGLAENSLQRSLEMLDGREVVRANPRLKVTQNMQQAIVHMRQVFQIYAHNTSNEKNEKSA